MHPFLGALWDPACHRPLHATGYQKLLVVGPARFAEDVEVLQLELAVRQNAEQTEKVIQGWDWWNWLPG